MSDYDDGNENQVYGEDSGYEQGSEPGSDESNDDSSSSPAPNIYIPKQRGYVDPDGDYESAGDPDVDIAPDTDTDEQTDEGHSYNKQMQAMLRDLNASIQRNNNDSPASQIPQRSVPQRGPIQRTVSRVPHQTSEHDDIPYHVHVFDGKSLYDSSASASASVSESGLTRGGLKVSKKVKVDPLYLQNLINKDLRARIPIEAFKQEKLVTMVKNTVGIKCKACGSDNVYVESKQVRSADEAMTKFYTCLECGNKWRFD